MSNSASKTIRFHGDDLLLELADRLLHQGKITETQLGEIQNRTTLTGTPLDQLLLSEKLVDEKTFLTEMSTLSGIPFHDIGEFRIEQSVADRVTAKVALRHGIMPLADHQGILTLATWRVPNLATVDGLRMVLDAPLEWILCTESDVRMSLTHFYGLGAETIDQLIAETEEHDDDAAAQDIAAHTQETGMVRFINLVIAEAIRLDTTSTTSTRTRTCVQSSRTTTTATTSCRSTVDR